MQSGGVSESAPPPSLPTQPATLLTPRVLIPFIIVTLIWGSTWFVIREQLEAAPPVWSVTYRFIIAGAAMVALILVRRESIWLDKAGWSIAAMMGLTQFVLNYNFVYSAEKYVTSGLVAVVFALLIIPNSLFARLWLKTPLSRAFLVGCGIAVGGVALLLLHEYRVAESIGKVGGGASVMLGIGLTLVAVCSASLSNVVQGIDAARRQPMLALVGWAMLIGAAMDAGFALVTQGPPVFPRDPYYWAGVTYLAIAGSTLTFPLYYTVIRAVGPGPAAWSSVLIPVIAMLISTAFEGYHWSGLAISGSILVIAGLVLAVRGKG